MNLAWKVVVFVFFINISSGIVTNVLGLESNVEYNENILNEVDVYDVRNPETDLLGDAPIQTETNWADNLLGLLGLGFITDIMNFFTDYLFGLIDIVLKILPSEAVALEPYFYGIMTLIYTISIFSLFTGKTINSEG